MSFPGILRDWLTKINGCISTLGHNGKNLTYVKADGTTGVTSRPVHRYTLPANTERNWYRIAQSTRSQLEPVHAQFIVRAKNAYNGSYKQVWFVDTETFGNYGGIRIFGNNNAPVSQARVVYRYTPLTSITNESLSYLELYLNYKVNQPTEIEIEEICNDGYEFAVDGALSVGSVPSGLASRAVYPYASGVHQCNQADYGTYSDVNYLDISADTTLKTNSTDHCQRLISCTGTITLTIPAPTGTYRRDWYWIKNNGSGIVTLHPAAVDIYFDNVNEDITLQPGEWVRLHVQSTKHYVISGDGRWQSKKLDAASADYIKSLSLSGQTLTVTKGDDTTSTLTTQDTVYTHPTTSGNKHIPSGGSSGQILRWSADGTAAWGDDNNTVYTHPSYTARTGKPTGNLTPGFGDAVTISQITSDATGHVTAATDRSITIPSTTATQSAPGLMSAADKTALDTVGAGYIKALTYSGKELTATKGDNSTATVTRPIHRYTIAANTNKNWFRIAQSSIGQLHPMHCEFILRAKNAGSVDNYQVWHVFMEVYGNASGIHVLGGPNLPISTMRVLYENTIASVTDEKLTYIDIYCNQKNAYATEIEIEEVYNDGMVFLADGTLSVSTIPSGYENRAVSANQSGIQYSSQSDTSNYSRIQYTAVTADATLAASWSYRMRVMNCTQPVTLTVNQTGAGSDCVHWIKNSSSGVVTIHPATATIYFDDVNEDITLQPGEFLKIQCQSASHYVVLEDGRWKSQKADDADIWDGGSSADL